MRRWRCGQPEGAQYEHTRLAALAAARCRSRRDNCQQLESGEVVLNGTQTCNLHVSGIDAYVSAVVCGVGLARKSQHRAPSLSAPAGGAVVGRRTGSVGLLDVLLRSRVWAGRRRRRCMAFAVSLQS